MAKQYYIQNEYMYVYILDYCYPIEVLQNSTKTIPFSYEMRLHNIYIYILNTLNFTV